MTFWLPPTQGPRLPHGHVEEPALAGRSGSVTCAYATHQQGVHIYNQNCISDRFFQVKSHGNQTAGPDSSRTASATEDFSGLAHGRPLEAIITCTYCCCQLPENSLECPNHTTTFKPKPQRMCSSPKNISPENCGLLMSSSHELSFQIGHAGVCHKLTIDQNRVSVSPYVISQSLSMLPRNIHPTVPVYSKESQNDLPCSSKKPAPILADL